MRTLRDSRGDVLDQALLLWFPGPASATGEDLAELHVHGGIAVVAAVSRALEAAGARPAEPGEFTRRALFNGRLDLDAVEGLADLLSAETEVQRRAAIRRTEGALGRQMRDWTTALVALSAQVEAAIDYDGDDEVAALPPCEGIEDLARQWEAALARPPADRLRDGVRVAIVGPVNAGKSSLFNALVGQDAAIVSDRAGTTRDLIERTVAIGGVPMRLIDTAGEREAAEPIEAEGIARARRAAAAADLVIDMHPDARPGPGRIAVQSKVDLAPAPSDHLGVSARTGVGVDALVSALVAAARDLLPGEDEVALEQRHRGALIEAIAEVRAASTAPEAALVADHLRRARMAIDRVAGGADTETMLDALFGRFCLGK